MKKIGMVLLSAVTLILETLPFGAVLIFGPSPTERIRKEYSYFDLELLWYINFTPFVTGLLTCVLLLLGLLALGKDNLKIMKILFVLSVATTIVSLMPLLLGWNYYTVLGGVITFLLALQAGLSRACLKTSA